MNNEYHDRNWVYRSDDYGTGYYEERFPLSPFRLPRRLRLAFFYLLPLTGPLWLLSCLVIGSLYAVGFFLLGPPIAICAMLWEAFKISGRPDRIEVDQPSCAD